MKTIRGLHLLMVLGVLMATAGIFTTPADAQTIYALLLIDDGNPGNYTQHQTSQKKMTLLLTKIKGELGIEIVQTTLRSEGGREAPHFPTSENIKKWIDEVNVDHTDVVFIYSSSHGGADRETRELYLNFAGVKVERPPIAEALEALPCRLKLLVTDACSYGVEIQVPYVNTLKEAYKNLFLEHEGFLNLAAATEGEYAGGDDNGGWFTQAFIEIMETAHHYDTDENDFVSWEEIFVATKNRTEEIFSVGKINLSDYWKGVMDRIGQQSQRPKYFGELPKRISN